MHPQIVNNSIPIYSVPSSPPTPTSAISAAITATPRVSSPLNPSSASSSATSSTTSLPIQDALPLTAPIPIPYRRRGYSISTIRDLNLSAGGYPSGPNTPPISSPLSGNFTPPTSFMTPAPSLTLGISSPGSASTAPRQRRTSNRVYRQSPSLGSELESFSPNSFRSRSRSPAQRFNEHDHSPTKSNGERTPTLPSAPLLASAPSAAGWGPGSKKNAALGIAAQPPGQQSRSLSASWWGSEDDEEKELRPWRHQSGDDDEKKKVPEEQAQSWERTRHRVAKAVASTIGTATDIAHEALYIGVDLLELAPVPGLSSLANTLLNIWDAVDAVDIHRLACLRLTERCADILLSVRQEVHEAGGDVQHELNEALKRLEDVFIAIATFMEKQAHRPFLKRYLRRDEILRQIADCDADLRDAVEMFSVSVQIRILKQVQAAEVQRRQDTQRILHSIINMQLQTAGYSTGSPPPAFQTPSPESSPKLGFASLPRSASQATIYGSGISRTSSRKKTEDRSPIGLGLTFGQPLPQYQSPELPILETIPIQLPVPDVDRALQFPFPAYSEHPPSSQPAQAGDPERSDPSSHEVMDPFSAPIPLDTLMNVPPEAQIIPMLRTLCLLQNSMDAAHDMVDLRSLLRAALQTSNDAEMMKVLQVGRDEMPEAIKTLQRALEREVEEGTGTSKAGTTALLGDDVKAAVPTKSINVRVREAIADPEHPQVQKRHLMRQAALMGNLMTATGTAGVGGIVEVAPVGPGYQMPHIAGGGHHVGGFIEPGHALELDSSMQNWVAVVPPTPHRRKTMASVESCTSESTSESDGLASMRHSVSADGGVPTTAASPQGPLPPPNAFAGFMIPSDSSKTIQGYTAPHSASRDTLDREFIENGIDALCRMSRGVYDSLPTLPSWTITRYEVDRDQRVGLGFFSDVYKGTWKGKVVAIKVLAETTPRELFIREVEIWKTLKHANVLELYGASSASSEPPWFFVSPYLKRGSLVAWLKSLIRGGTIGAGSGDLGRSRKDSSRSSVGIGLMTSVIPPTSAPGSPRASVNMGSGGGLGATQTGARKTSFPDWVGWNFPRKDSLGSGAITKERNLLRYMHEIANGMEYLHSQGVLHGDLKAANVLVDDHLHCVITDFGQSEMKSEAYRISGKPMPHGTLRWQAPEVLAGNDHLTTEVDVYAFAICCIEVLGFGKMPWQTLDDEIIRHIVVREHGRPNIPDVQPFTTAGLKDLLRKCWDTDSFARPAFSDIVILLSALRKNVGQIQEEMPSPRISELKEMEGLGQTKVTESPDMRPVPLPENGTSSSHNAAGILIGMSPTYTTPPSGSEASSAYQTATDNSYSPSSLPTNYTRRDSSFSRGHNTRNIHEGEDYGSGSENRHLVDMGIGLGLIDISSVSAESTEGSMNAPQPARMGKSMYRMSMPEPQFFTGLEGRNLESGERSVSVHEVGFGPGSGARSSLLSHSIESPRSGLATPGGNAVVIGGTLSSSPPSGDGFLSPSPENERMAEMKNERRYRMLLSHEFHPSLTLPLWDPIHVQLGDIGYLSRPSGRFVTLFNAFRPHKSAGGLASGLPNIKGFGSFRTGRQRQDKRNAAQRGLDVFFGFVSSRRAHSKAPLTIARTWDFPLRSGHKVAHLYTESTMYRYIDSLGAPKRWFSSNVDQILEIYGPLHRIQKEELFLVIGTLDTPAHGLFISHHHPDGQGHFNVYSSPKVGTPWGEFTTDKGLAGDSIKHGPSYNEPANEKPVFATKVSNTLGSDEPWKTVLIARLRFKPDVAEPTSL